MSIALYTLIWAVFYLWAKRKYKIAGVIVNQRDDKTKMTIQMMVIMSLGFAFFNYYITEIYGFLTGDTLNYTLQFNGEQREAVSFGLGVLFKFIKTFNGGIHAVFYFTTFVCVFITLYAYRISKVSSPQVLLMFFLSQLIEGTIINVKQAYASAIATVFFVIVIEVKDQKIKDVLCVLLSIVAGLFHGTGWMLLFVYIIIRNAKRRKRMALYIAIMMISVLFFGRIMTLAGTIIMHIIPRLGASMIEYANPGAGNDMSGIVAVMKGFPFYIITLLGVIYRKGKKHSIEQYDTYLLICLISSTFYLMTMHSYWMQRVIYLFFMPNFLFWTKLKVNIDNRSNARLYNIAICLSLAFFTYREYVMIWW